VNVSSPERIAANVIVCVGVRFGDDLRTNKLSIRFRKKDSRVDVTFCNISIRAEYNEKARMCPMYISRTY